MYFQEWAMLSTHRKEAVGMYLFADYGAGQ